MSHDLFVQRVRRIVHGCDRMFQATKILEIDSARQFLSNEEISQIEAKNRLPKWLLEELQLTPEYSQSSDYKQFKIIDGSPKHVAPVTVFGGGDPPATMLKLVGNSPDIFIVYGEDTTFSVANHAKAAFQGDRYINLLTDSHNLWLWEAMKHLEPIQLPGHTLMCVVEGSAVFTHFLLDTLPRFEVLRLFGLAPDNFDQIVFATDQTPFHQEAIQKLNLNPAHVLTRQKIGQLIRCEKFTAVTATREQFFADDSIYSFFNQFYGIDKTLSSPFRRLFISRSNASRRRILNETELHDVLLEFDFEIVRLEELTVSEAAKLFSETRTVVAPHGAGLANAVFMPSGGGILELFGYHISSEYWRIANQRKIRHMILKAEDPAKSIDTTSDAQGFFARNAADLIVNPKKLREALAQIITDNIG